MSETLQRSRFIPEDYEQPMRSQPLRDNTRQTAVDCLSSTFVIWVGSLPLSVRNTHTSHEIHLRVDAGAASDYQRNEWSAKGGKKLTFCFHVGLRTIEIQRDPHFTPAQFSRELQARLGVEGYEQFKIVSRQTIQALRHEQQHLSPQPEEKAQEEVRSLKRSLQEATEEIHVLKVCVLKQFISFCSK